MYSLLIMAEFSIDISLNEFAVFTDKQTHKNGLMIYPAYRL